MERKKNLKLNLASLNFLKGMAILVVVLYHICQDFIAEPSGLLAGLVSVLMPLFLILSGYLFSVKPVKMALRQTTGELLKPYLIVQIFNMLLYPIRCILQGKGIIYGLMTMGSAIVLGASDTFMIGTFKVGTIGPVWFLLVLYESWNLLNVIMQIKSAAGQFVCVILCALTGLLLAHFDVRYFCLAPALVAVFFLYIGYEIKKSHWIEKEKRWYEIAVLILIAVISLNFSYVHMAKNIYRLGIFELLGTTAISYWLIQFGIRISKLNFALVDWIISAGRYSFWILCIHSVIFTSMPWQVFRRLIQNPVWCISFLIVYNAFFIIAVSLVLVKMNGIVEYLRKKRNVTKG